MRVASLSLVFGFVFTACRPTISKEKCQRKEAAEKARIVADKQRKQSDASNAPCRFSEDAGDDFDDGNGTRSDTGSDGDGDDDGNSNSNAGTGTTPPGAAVAAVAAVAVAATATATATTLQWWKQLHV